MKQYAKSFKTNFHHSVKHARIRFYADPHSALIRANTGEQKNLFSHIFHAKHISPVLLLIVYSVNKFSKHVPLLNCLHKSNTV